MLYFEFITLWLIKNCFLQLSGECKNTTYSRGKAKLFLYIFGNAIYKLMFSPTHECKPLFHVQWAFQPYIYHIDFYHIFMIKCTLKKLLAQKLLSFPKYLFFGPNIFLGAIIFAISKNLWIF
jgi:hypothetical protein